MAAVALGLSSCKQEDEPKYHNPTVFTINTPALQNQEILTNGDMTDPATFNLFCSQPNYGYSAICNYSALVSLDPNAPLDKWIALPNETPTMAAMSIKLFDLGVAVNKLLGIEDAEAFEQGGYGNNNYVCYFKAVCEIPSIEGSKIISSNTVSYNQVRIVYAEKKPGWIYILGDIQNPETGKTNGFEAPAMSNYDLYKNNFSLYEPEDMIGEKIYVGVFNMVPKEKNPDKSYEDNCSQFRFMTQLAGWKADFSYGSNEADFYCVSITDQYAAGFKGSVVAQGLGNWGIYTDEYVPVTIVFDLNGLKLYVREGVHNVSFTGRDPNFE